MNNPKTTMAFTMENNNGLQNRLISAAIVSNDSVAESFIALWDTGATNTCISAEVVSKLALKAAGKKTMKTPSGSDHVNTYLVSITLPNNVKIENVEVCDSAIGEQGIGVLIGMDIISLGDFAVSNYMGKTAFTFRIPSVKKIDFVKETNLLNTIGTHGKGKHKKH